MTFEEGEALAREFKISFVETSALNNINVDEAFMKLSKEVKVRLASDDVGKNSVKKVAKRPGPSNTKPLERAVFSSDNSKDNNSKKKSGSWCSIL